MGHATIDLELSSPGSGVGSGAGSGSPSQQPTVVAVAKSLVGHEVADELEEAAVSKLELAVQRHIHITASVSIPDRLVEGVCLPWEILFWLSMPNCKMPASTKMEHDDDDALWPGAEEHVPPWKKAEKRPEMTAVTAVEKAASHGGELTWGQRHYYVTFIVSLAWIGAISYFNVEFILKLGCIWRVSALVMGITFLAIGASIPDTLGSTAVARAGKPNMAVSNALGACIFNLCIGLGLPMFIHTLSQPDEKRRISDPDTLVTSIIAILAILVLLIGVLSVSKFVLKPSVGSVLFVIYVAYSAYHVASNRAKNSKCPA